jgi:uncharacterized protein
MSTDDEGWSDPGRAVRASAALLRTSLLADMRGLVLGSFRRGTEDTPIPRRPFRLDPTSVTRPSHFEIDVIVGGERWQYGFDVTETDVVAEYPYRFPKGRQSLVFERDSTSFRFGPSIRSAGRMLAKITRRNSLLLSVAGATDDSELGPLSQWFVTNLRLADADSRGIRAARTIELVESYHHDRRMSVTPRSAARIIASTRENAGPEFVDRMRRAIGILNGAEDQPDGSDAEHLVVEDFVRLTHRGPDGRAELDPDEESGGTLAWIAIIGSVVDALDGGHVLLADELDASLHPRLGEQLVRLFQDQATNLNGAQLIFNAHNQLDATRAGSQRRPTTDHHAFTASPSSGPAKTKHSVAATSKAATAAYP